MKATPDPEKVPDIVAAIHQDTLNRLGEVAKFLDKLRAETAEAVKSSLSATPDVPLDRHPIFEAESLEKIANPILEGVRPQFHRTRAGTWLTTVRAARSDDPLADAMLMKDCDLFFVMKFPLSPAKDRPSRVNLLLNREVYGKEFAVDLRDTLQKQRQAPAVKKTPKAAVR